MAAAPKFAGHPEAGPRWLPLAEAQSGLWYAQRIDPANPILNTGQYVELVGPLDIDAFRAAHDRMVAETDALALRFCDTPEGPRQAVDETLRPWLETVDLSAAADPMAAALAEIARDAETPVDLERGPLAAFRLYMLGRENFVWYERIHHLAIDGYGMVLVTNRVGELYSAAKGGASPGPAFAGLSAAVDEDAAYRASDRRAVDAEFWRKARAGAAEVVGMAPGRPVSADRFHRETLDLDVGLMRHLTDYAAQAKVTWPDVLVALVSAYCRRFAGTPEITVGVPFMGRLGSATARVPCTVMNVLPLRVAPDETAPLGDCLVKVSKDLVQARKHGRYRSEQLRRDLGLIGGERRLFGPMVNVQPFDMPPRFKDLGVKLHILGAGSVDDITFTFRGDAKAALTLEVDSNPNLYSAEETAAHAARLVAFLDRAMDARTLAEVPIASPEEIRRTIFDANATAHPVPDTTLPAMIEAAMRRSPNAEALRFGQESLTYAELDRRSDALASHLAGLGVGPEAIVAVALPRSLELVVALVAILRAGGAYLPLDLEHPRARLETILTSARPACVLVFADDAPLLDGLAPLLSTDAWPAEGTLEKPSPARPENMAYVIYTSGSTGEPKGVVIEHRAIVNRLEWMRQHYGFAADDRILQKTPATFDVSVWEFFLPLIAGATLVVAPPGAHRDPAAIAALIRGERITTAHFVPSMLSAFLASPAVAGLSLRRVFCSGEELTADQRDRFHRTIRAELHNLYGPTEAAVDVSFWPAASDWSSPVPIGFPVWNTRLYVLDNHMNPLPPGVAGHLFLGGVQLARGYLGRDDLTAERFLPDPFLPGERIYRTGDLARLRADGAVVFLGRSDHQVKIRGLRIELGEIEAAVLVSGLVAEAAVIAREDRPGDRRIVCYLVPTAPAQGLGETVPEKGAASAPHSPLWGGQLPVGSADLDRTHASTPSSSGLSRGSAAPEKPLTALGSPVPAVSIPAASDRLPADPRDKPEDDAVEGYAQTPDAVVLPQGERERKRGSHIEFPSFDEDALRRRLAQRLPEYMVPSAFVALEALPVTGNGKLDRTALPAPGIRDTGIRIPRTPTEQALAGLFSKILGLDRPVMADADFFTLGGDSLLAVHLMLAVQEKLGRDPGIGLLFEHPTVAALAAALDADAEAHDSGLGPIIRLAEGKVGAPPLFIVHPAGGISWGYRSLARALAPARDVYGLQAPGLDPATPMPESLDALAADYVARIRAVRPRGPYHLAGWSVGGIIAHAMAVRLAEAGEQIGLLALLDSYPSECWRAEPEPDRMAALRALLAIAGYDPDGHPELDTRERIVAFLRAGNSALGRLPEVALDGVIRVVLDTNRLVRGHHHRRFPGTLTHVRAALDHAGRPLTPQLWLNHAEALDPVDVPFLHPQIVGAEATAIIAPELARRLAARDGRTS